jgi:hypothetical protein
MQMTFEAWFTGFCDGEASFTFALSLKSGIVRPRFNLCLVNDQETLIEVHRHFRLSANIEPNRKKRAGKAPSPQHQLSCQSKNDLKILAQHFQSYPLKTKKKDVFEVWHEMVREYLKPDYSKENLLLATWKLTKVKRATKGRSKDAIPKLLSIAESLGITLQ